MPSIVDEENDAPCSPTSSSNNFGPIAKEIEYTVKNTFIDYPAWESLRNPSLEGFFREREIKSCPASRVQSLDDTQACEAQEVPSIEERIQPVERPALRSLSLEECLRDIEAKYQDFVEDYDDVSTKANTEEDTAPPTPEILSDSEEDTKPHAVISLANSLGLWSIGSAEHSLGTCKPCAFLWKDASGCENGTNCTFCHMCPPGEVKRRKKEKLAIRKIVKQFHRPQAQAFQGAGHFGMC